MLIFWHLLHVEPRNGLNQSPFHRAKVKSLKKKKFLHKQVGERNSKAVTIAVKGKGNWGWGGLKYLN